MEEHAVTKLDEVIRIQVYRALGAADGDGRLAVSLLSALDDLCIEKARRVRDDILRKVIRSPGYDTLTYFDSVPESCQSLLTGAALLSYQLGADDADTWKALEVAAMCCSASAHEKKIILDILEQDYAVETLKDIPFPFETRPSAKEPILLENEVIKQWPAFREWTSIDAFCKFHSARFIPVENQRKQRLIRFGNLRTSYLAQHRLFDHMPSLASKIARPSPLVHALCAWASYSATHTPIHADPLDNIVIQILGAKQWRLWPPLEQDQSGSSDTSQPPLEFTLYPGSTLFVPAKWRHEVYSLPGSSTPSDRNADTDTSCLTINYWLKSTQIVRRNDIAGSFES